MAGMKTLLFATVVLMMATAASTLPCNVTSWSIIGDEFNLRHSSCQEIPANGALEIAVPAGFDLSNSDIIKQNPEGWKLTKYGTKQIKFTSTDKTDANQVVEITLSNANAPAHYIVPFHKKFTEFSRVVSKQDVDCAQCTAEIWNRNMEPTKAPTYSFEKARCTVPGQCCKQEGQSRMATTLSQEQETNKFRLGLTTCDCKSCVQLLNDTTPECMFEKVMGNSGSLVDKDMPQKTTCGVTEHPTCDKRVAVDSLGCTNPCVEGDEYENTVGVCTPAYCACRSHMGDDKLYKHSSVIDQEFGCGNEPDPLPPMTQNFEGTTAKEACDACRAVWLSPDGEELTFCPTS